MYATQDRASCCAKKNIFEIQAFRTMSRVRVIGLSDSNFHEPAILNIFRTQNNLSALYGEECCPKYDSLLLCFNFNFHMHNVSSLDSLSLRVSSLIKLPFIHSAYHISSHSSNKDTVFIN